MSLPNLTVVSVSVVEFVFVHRSFVLFVPSDTRSSPDSLKSEPRDRSTATDFKGQLRPIFAGNDTKNLRGAAAADPCLRYDSTTTIKAVVPFQQGEGERGRPLAERNSRQSLNLATLRSEVQRLPKEVCFRPSLYYVPINFSSHVLQSTIASVFILAVDRRLSCSQNRIIHGLFFARSLPYLIFTCTRQDNVETPRSISSGSILTVPPTVRSKTIDKVTWSLPRYSGHE